MATLIPSKFSWKFILFFLVFSVSSVQAETSLCRIEERPALDQLLEVIRFLALNPSEDSGFRDVSTGTHCISSTGGEPFTCQVRNDFLSLHMAISYGPLSHTWLSTSSAVVYVLQPVFATLFTYQQGEVTDFHYGPWVKQLFEIATKLPAWQKQQQRRIMTQQSLKALCQLLTVVTE